jgi:hypothetical protein
MSNKVIYDLDMLSLKVKCCVFYKKYCILNVIVKIPFSFSLPNSHGICKVAWHKVIKSKPLGGLGLGFIHSKNLALMFKWLWNLDKGVVGGWQELILRKYLPHFANG